MTVVETTDRMDIPGHELTKVRAGGIARRPKGAD